jgi:hypothetical protein
MKELYSVNKQFSSTQRHNSACPPELSMEEAPLIPEVYSMH